MKTRTARLAALLLGTASLAHAQVTPPGSGTASPAQSGGYYIGYDRIIDEYRLNHTPVELQQAA
jgi:hypothetical protein